MPSYTVIMTDGYVLQSTSVSAKSSKVALDGRFKNYKNTGAKPITVSVWVKNPDTDEIESEDTRTIQPAGGNN